jgi:hypothetical protein
MRRIAERLKRSFARINIAKLRLRQIDPGDLGIVAISGNAKPLISRNNAKIANIVPLISRNIAKIAKIAKLLRACLRSRVPLACPHSWYHPL